MDFDFYKIKEFLLSKNKGKLFLTILTYIVSRRVKKAKVVHKLLYNTIDGSVIVDIRA